MLVLLTDDLLSPAGPENDLSNKQGDDSYVYSLRLLLRDVLSQRGWLEDPEARRWVEKVKDKSWFIEVLQSVPTADAASFSLQRLQAGRPITPAALTHIARNGETASITEVIALAKKVSSSAISLLHAISDGLSERGVAPPPELLTWAQELAQGMLAASANKPVPAWTLVPSAKAPVWSLKTRKCADGTEAQVLQSMAAGGGEEESRTGILRSKDFAAPTKLTLWINGHRGFPKTEAHDKNLVRVVEAKSGETLASAFPPAK